MYYPRTKTFFFSGVMKSESVSAYGIFKKKFVTRAEASLLKHPCEGVSKDALEVFGETVAFVAYGFTNTFKDLLENGVLAKWNFASTGDIVFVDPGDVHITLDYPEAGDVSFYARISPAHMNTDAVFSVVEEASGDVLYTFPTILCREMERVSNVLAVYNPITEPRLLPGCPYTEKIYATASPRIFLQIFPSPLHAYKACCIMQQEIQKLKRGRTSLLGGLSSLSQDIVEFSYQRPILLEHETAKILCVSKNMKELREPGLIPMQLVVPEMADVCLFQSMWEKY